MPFTVPVFISPPRHPSRRRPPAAAAAERGRAAETPRPGQRPRPRSTTSRPSARGTVVEEGVDRHRKENELAALRGQAVFPAREQVRRPAPYEVCVCARN